jgi:hypothetical protein
MKELIKLAKEKGFYRGIGFFNFIFSTEPKLANYHWLCELQKWLCDEYNIHVYINPDYNGLTKKYGIIKIDDNLVFKCYGEEGFKSSNECLEKGLIEALKLIDC